VRFGADADVRFGVPQKMDTLAHLTVDEKILLAITVIVAVVVWARGHTLGDLEPGDL
jgi:hypothetical protein